jgi:putative ABC transport system ATP-binding protein
MSILIENVKFSYSNKLPENDICIESWSLGQGEKHFIFGPSGCGKSTLLNLISGVLRPSSGTITILGESIEKMSSRQRDRFRANNIGYIFQQFNLIDYLNAKENIALARQFSSNKQTINLADKIAELLTALGINENDWSRPISTLSIGQQQRIAIARAFINSPKLLIADEPTSSLDEPNRDKFLTLLNTLCDANQTTLLFVSHDTRLKHHFNLVQNFNDINFPNIKNKVVNH